MPSTSNRGRHRRGLAAAASAAALAVSLLVTGCGSDEDDADPATPAEHGDGQHSAAAGSGHGAHGAQPAPTGAVPRPAGMVGRWNQIASGCPVLDGQAARALGLPAAGTPGQASNDGEKAFIASCSWGSGPGSVSVLVNIDRTIGTPTAEQLTATKFQSGWDQSVGNGETLSASPETGLGDQAFMGIHKELTRVVMVVRSSNARILIFQEVPKMAPANVAAGLAQHRGAMRDLAADVLNDLS